MNTKVDEGKLISGDEAKKAWANGVAVQVDIGGGVFGDITSDDLLSVFDYATNKFRLKPRTISINGIEVPAPFKPEDGDQFWHLYPSMGRGYNFTVSIDSDHYQQFGAWRTEEEIKQVVAALRQVFGGSHDN